MFNITYDEMSNGKHYARGFQIKFANGYVLSVQFGAFNYCSNKDNTRRNNFVLGAVTDKYSKCDNCETAIIKPNGRFLKYKGDDVQGWQTANDVAEAITFINSLESNNYGRVA